MPFIMILYYIICAFLSLILMTIFIKEREDKEKMILCLIVLIPLIMRLLRLK
jgi:hypothetical protein